MTQDEIINLAKKAGARRSSNPDEYGVMKITYCGLEAFAKLVEEKKYEQGFIDGMQKQMQSSVDKAVNAMTHPTYYIPSKDQREWVGLTDREIEQEQWLNSGGSMTDFARAIETKLKEKNNG